VDLEVEVTAGAGGVAGFADRADPLSLPDGLTPAEAGGPRQVGVEIAPPLAFAVDQDEVAVENRIETGAQDLAVADRDQLRPTRRRDVEPFVDAAAAAGRVVFADRPPRPMRSLNREDVAVVGNAAIVGDDPGGGGSDRQAGERGKSQGGRAPQWCSITRSTMLYPFASSALMK
jgi:hypothetical protein